MNGMARMVRKALSCDTMAAAMSPPTAMPSSSSSAMVRRSPNMSIYSAAVRMCQHV